MISLFITALLGLFCCSSINYNAVDHTKEIELREEKPINNVVYNDNGEIILTSGDLQSTSFFLNFTTGLIQAGYVTFSANSQYNYSLLFDSNIGEYFGAWLLDYTGRQPLHTIEYVKTYYDYIVRDNTTYYRNKYELSFYTLSSGYYRFTYWVVATDFAFAEPFTLTSSMTTNNSLDVLNFSYTNDTTEDPIYKYFIPNYKQHEYTQDYVYSQGYNDGYNNGKGDGYQHGYNDGLRDGADYDDISLTIFTGILEVGLLPVNVFLQLLNFEVFGINIGGLVTSLLTIAIVVIIIRVVTGKKDD